MPVLTTNINIVYFSSSSWIIARGVIVSGGAEAGTTNSILVNYGSLFDASGSAVRFGDLGSGSLYNEPDGLITCFNGVEVFGGGGVSIRNRGDIFGFGEHGIHIIGAGNNVTITNIGDIFGALGGVTASSGSATNVRITNSGVIDSDQHGIWLLNAVSASPVIVNSGIISGSVSAIRAENGDRLNVTNTGQIIGNVTALSLNQSDTIINNGTVRGNLNLGSGNDFYSGIGSVSGFISGLDGNDTFSGGNGAERMLGGPGNDTLTGNGGNDILEGNSGNDVLNGGLGNDILTGDAGRDIRTGAAGNDSFRFRVSSDSLVGALADVITDFDDFGNDVIDLSALAGTLVYRHNLAFTAAGQVRINDIAGADVLVEINTGGTLAADQQIRLTNTTLASMTATDFLL